MALWTGFVTGTRAVGAAPPATGQAGPNAPLTNPPTATATGTVTQTAAATATKPSTPASSGAAVPLVPQPTATSASSPTPSATTPAATTPASTAPVTPAASPTGSPTATTHAQNVPLRGGTDATTPTNPDTPTATTPATATATRTPNPPTPTTAATPTTAPTPTGTPTGTPTAIPSEPPALTVPTLDLSSVTLLDDPGIGGNATIARAAVKHYGEYYRPDGVPWVGWCEMFVGDVLAEAGISHPRFETAMLDAISAPLYRGAAPAGSLVFFDQRSGPYGHVGISLGDMTMLSALGGGIVRTSYNWNSYVGWRPYGTTAPATDSFVVTPLLFVPLPQEAVTEPVVLMPSFDEEPSWYMPPPYRRQEDVEK